MRRTAVLCGFLWAVVGCASDPGPITPLVKEEIDPEFPRYKDRLGDLVVLPLRDAAGAGPGLASRVRRKVYERLLERFYSPLSLEAVDRAVEGLPEEARSRPEAVRGRLAEDAVLALELLQWDARWVASKGKVLAGGRAALVRSSDGRKVWETEFRDTFLELPARLRSEPHEARQEGLRDLLAERLLEGLPRRR